MGDLLCQDILLKTSCNDHETFINLWALFPSLSKMYILAALLFCIPLVQFQFSYASSSPDIVRSVNLYAKRDGHHNHDAAPLLELNETEITLYHAPTPPSYYTIDWENEGYENRHGGLIIAHGLFMSLAFFVALPMGIALRSVKHPAHWMATFSFYLFCALGCAVSGLYRKSTPTMYEGAVHGSQGYMIILLAISLSVIDIIATVRRLLDFIKGPNKSLKSFWRCILNQKVEDIKTSEYDPLIQNESNIYSNAKLAHSSVELNNDVERHSDTDLHETEQWANINSHQPRHSTHVLSRALRLVGQNAFVVTERFLIFAGFGQLLIGIVTYTGGCRQNYINGCLAHLIKGSIFWCYGLITFGRFLGSYADLGWAWNRLPSEDHYTAEFLESFVIFLYGATNTWMERFGAKPGDPFSTKQIQHISIAVMFCFAGLVGMGIESGRMRKWLAHSVFPSSQSSVLPQDAIEKPQSYRGSFNPFPALVIGVTGAAMSAHFQTYLFEVQIHALWGNLLVAFAVLRCMTYFFLWLGPPKSMLPSRPPTEALGSLFLTCGGLVFIFSTEEVTHAAMRRGRDDVMMFLNLSVAITCVAFCWTLCIVGFKGWLKSRNHKQRI